MDLLDRLLAHDDWATTQLLELCRDLTDEQLDQPFDIGHRTLRATFGHMIFNVPCWTGLMLGQPIEERTDRCSVATLLEEHRHGFATFAALAHQLRDQGRLDDTFVDHYRVLKSFGGAVLAVVLHNTEHRAEAVHILHRLGLPDVPEVDFGVWDYLQHNT